MSGDNNYLKTVSAQLNGVQAIVNILRQDLSLANTKLVHYYPEVKNTAAWRDCVVTRINECLRRPRRGHNEIVNPTEEGNIVQHPPATVQQTAVEPGEQDSDEEEYVTGPPRALAFADI